MEVYFGSMKLPQSDIRPDNLVTFCIPDIGVKFKAPYNADDDIIDYASLLTLLEFIEVNPQLFNNRSLELFCNNFDLVNQINDRQPAAQYIAPLIEKAQKYRNRMNYSLNWVPRPDNPAQSTEID